MHPAIRARLRIGAANDPLEHEADRVAQAVMRMPKRAAARPAISREASVPPQAAGGIQALPGRGRPLDHGLREFFAPRLGWDLSGVRVHTDSRAAEFAEAIHARAFAVGGDVAFGRGEYAPETAEGRKLIAHELTHVVQQQPQTSPATIRRQTDTDPPRFPDFPNLTLKLEEDVGKNLLDYGHHFYRLATLFPDRPELLQQAFGRYALGANLLQTGFGFLGFDRSAATGLAYGTGILFKGLTFLKEGEVVLDFQFDIGRGLKLETSLNLGVNPDDYSDVRKADVGIGVVGRF